MTATILVVEDHDILRWSLRTWLEFAFPECQIFEAADETQATRLAEAHQPGVILLEERLADGRSFASVPRLREVSPASMIVVMTDYDEDIHRIHALNSGANASVHKRAMLTQLQPMITSMVYA